jgi:hypothetical protein
VNPADWPEPTQWTTRDIVDAMHEGKFDLYPHFNPRAFDVDWRTPPFAVLFGSRGGTVVEAEVIVNDRTSDSTDPTHRPGPGQPTYVVINGKHLLCTLYAWFTGQTLAPRRWIADTDLLPHVAAVDDDDQMVSFQDLTVDAQHRRLGATMSVRVLGLAGPDAEADVFAWLNGPARIGGKERSS